MTSSHVVLDFRATLLI